MNRKIDFLNGLLLTVLIFTTSCNNTVSVQPFSLKALTPVVVEKNGAEIFQYWEFKNDPFLWETNLVDLPALKSYKDSLVVLLGTDTLDFIINSRSYQNESYPSVNTNNGDSINAQLVHSKSLGKIRPINFLEAQLLDYQLTRYPLLIQPTEFLSFILFQDSLNIVRVYFAASDQPWPPKSGVILEDIKKDLREGWSHKFNLHNHYEPKSNQYLGILAPSTSDAQIFSFFAEDFNLEQALITNGFHTVEIDSSEFKKFKSPDID